MSVLNIFSSHLLAVINNVSVWWHVVGAAAIVVILLFVPDQHQSLQLRLHRALQQLRLFGGETGTLGFWFAIVPFGFLLTQYTITGFDAWRTCPRRPQGAAKAAAKGIWQSIFYSAVGGYILLLAVVFAIPDDASGTRTTRVRRRRRGLHLRAGAGRQLGGPGAVHLGLGQLFCATSCLTSPHG